MLNKLFQPLATCFMWFQGETPISHCFALVQAGWCSPASRFSCVAAEGKRKVDVDLGGDALLFNSNRSVIFLNKQMSEMGEERRLIPVIVNIPGLTH